MNKSIIVLSAVVCGFCGCEGRQLSDEGRLPIRIGILADSQITSKNFTANCQYKSKELDEQIETAIRPPALAHLAPDMLVRALEKLTEPNANVNVILYLGDGANSGGESEVNDLFRILAKFRQEHHIPIFVVIGNHDYLGAGNTEDFVQRVLLLNRVAPGKDEAFTGRYERPLSKCEVLEKIRSFNRISGRDYGDSGAGSFTYEDRPEGLDCTLDHKTGLYLAGHVAYSENGEEIVDILLADTSDYQDTEFEPKLGKSSLISKTWELYGSKGSISFVGKKKPPQGRHLRELGQDRPERFRFVASHYPPDHLDRMLPELTPAHGAIELVGSMLGSTFAAQHLTKLYVDARRNYWLSGHTHRKSMRGQPQMTFENIFGKRSFGSINVGSTTDLRAHVAVIEAYQKGKNKRVRSKDEVGYREIPVYDGSPSVAEVVGAATEWGKNHRSDKNFQDPALQNMGNKDFGVSILGLTREYQKDYWTAGHSDASVAHLTAFINWFAERRLKHGQAKARGVRACLAFIAGAYEEKLDPLKEYKAL